MKKRMLVILALALNVTAAAIAQTDDLDKDFRSLGGNKEILERAQMLDPNNKVRIVQNRLVDRTWRLEVGADGGIVNGGDTFIETTNFGLRTDLHITPRWSVGARVYQSFNSLTAQGEAEKKAILKAKEAGDYSDVFDIDYPERTVMGTLAWYPIYGKLNLFDAGISQFDVYALIGAGTVTTKSGDHPTFTVGGGVGVWLTNHISTRFEARYQSYSDENYLGTRDLDIMVINASIGFIL
jgi:outer membrane beta-barrel protein